MTKNFYPLIGKQVPTEDWVVKLKARPDLIFAYKETDMISASPCPLLYWDQLPLAWKNQDPGFRIFLRERVESVLPEWVLNPLTAKDQQPPFYTFKSRRQTNPIRNVLILQHHQMSSKKWEDLVQQFPDAVIKWISYSSPQLPDWPLEARLDFRLYCYIQDWRPDALYDLNYGQGDTFSPIHLHALHQGACLLNEVPDTGYNEPKDSLVRWYGEWKIFYS